MWAWLWSLQTPVFEIVVEKTKFAISTPLCSKSSTLEVRGNRKLPWGCQIKWKGIPKNGLGDFSAWWHRSFAGSCLEVVQAARKTQKESVTECLTWSCFCLFYFFLWISHSIKSHFLAMYTNITIKHIIPTPFAPRVGYKNSPKTCKKVSKNEAK